MPEYEDFYIYAAEIVCDMHGTRSQLLIVETLRIYT